jgi:hypothetical protein
MKTKWMMLSAIAVMGVGASSALAQTAAPAPTGSIEEQVIAKEREGLEALKAGNLQRFAALTADEAILVDDRGPATKAQVMKNVANFTLTDFSMEDIHFVSIASDTGLISYTITESGNSHGHQFNAQAYISSVWTRRGADWVCLFSQETGIRKPPPPPAAQK